MYQMPLEHATNLLLETWRNDKSVEACKEILETVVDSDFLRSIDFHTDYSRVTEDIEGYFVSVYPYHRSDYVCEMPIYGELEWIELIDAIVEAYYSDPGDLVAGRYTFRKL